MYRCTWNLGDVFAYKFTSEYSQEAGVYGKYVIMRKVSEEISWPGHIVPIMQIYKWIGSGIPKFEKISDMHLLPICFNPQLYIDNPKMCIDYNIKLLKESEKSIPKDNLSYLGNIPGGDLIPFRGNKYLSGCDNVGWESSKYNNKLEHFIIKLLRIWDCID